MLKEEDDQLLFQAYISLVLLLELHNSRFFESEHFESLNFSAPWIKNALRDVGVANKGSSLVALYAMLVIPKELIYDKYPDKVQELDGFLSESAEYVNTNYATDCPNVRFLRHVRNSVAHVRVTFEPCGAIVFRDCDPKNGESFEMKIPREALGQLLQRLQAVHYEHLGNLQAHGGSS